MEFYRKTGFVFFNTSAMETLITVGVWLHCTDQL
jgi:hypothetical protein